MIWRFVLLLALTATAAAAQEREWAFVTNDDQAWLGFGVPESDDAGIVFSCTMGTGAIKIYVPESRKILTPGSKANVSFMAGGQAFTYSAAILANEQAGIASLEADAAPGDPLFAALQAADRFALSIAGEDDMFPLAGSDFASLLSACRKGA